MPDRIKMLMASAFILTAAVAALFIVAAPGGEDAAFTGAGLERTLVIDPGHGGEDGGAVTEDGVRESVINLAIAEKMAAVCDFCGIRYVMTRDSEDIEYPENLTSTYKRKVYDLDSRIELIESVENAVLISIHQNKFTSPSPRGPQTFYTSADGGRELAELIQSNMNVVLFPQNRRVASQASGEIYMLKNLSCTAVLAECGFLSNPQEAAALVDGDYQTKVALCILAAYCVYSETQ